MKQELKCLRCQTEMIEGQVIDARFNLPGAWVDGIPEMGWLQPKVKSADRKTLRFYRCPACGYVEANVAT